MAKHQLSFIELHNQLFMQGSNLGTKIHAVARGATLNLDTELGIVWVQYKGKLSFIPLSNVASADMVDTGAFGFKTTTDETTAPAAIARARKARLEQEAEEDPHRAAVRAASANSNKPNTLEAQNDYLIQEARAQAAGMKHNKAQVSNPTLPTTGNTGASVAGKPKAISHAGMKAQVAAEMKE